MGRARLGIVAASFAAVLVGLPVLGCGSEDVPPDAVAVVGDTVLTKHEFEAQAARAPLRRMGVAAGGRIVYDPPGFTECVKGRRTNAPTASGQQLPPEAELKKFCEQEFRQLKDSVLASMIFSEWRRQEARRLNIEVTDSSVERRLERYLAGASGAQKAEFARGLEELGDRRKLIAEVRRDLVDDRLAAKYTDAVAPVTGADVRRYYEDHKDRFASRERRDVRVVLTADRPAADAARRALDGGAEWGAVVARYSIDETSKRRGGQMKGVKRGSGDPAFEKAIFESEPGRIIGPVESQFGWYVFAVERVDGTSSRPFEQVRSRIRELLRRKSERDALTKYERSLVTRYESQTKCAAQYEIEPCDG